MKKQRYFTFFDMIMCLNIVLFTFLSIEFFKQIIGFGVVMVIFALSNIGFLVQSITLRYQINTKIQEELEIEVSLETESFENMNNDFIKLKQEMLESRIAAKIQTTYSTAKVIKNAYIPKKDGTTSEIDLLMIKEDGIYIIEAKNLTGTITGNWKDDDELVLIHPNMNTYKITNPIKQNTHHFYALKNATGISQDRFKSIVVLGDHAKADYTTVPKGYARVCNLNQFSEQIKKLPNWNTSPLSDDEINTIYDTLNKYTKKTEEKENNHLKRIKKI